MKKKTDWTPNAGAEKEFIRALRKVASNAAHVVEVHTDGPTIRDEKNMVKVLAEYSDKLDPWARRQVGRMLERVSSKNKSAWTKNSKLMGKLLRETVAQSDVGRKAAQLMQEQVDLIKSLPVRAGLRAQMLAQKAVYEGGRSTEIAEELAATEEVSEADAERIARTEIARSNSVITQARAQAVGSTQYIWRTSGDAAVRDSHRKMNGKVIDWNKPPTLEDGTTGHAGTFPNCRCYPEPFFPLVE